MNEQRIATLRQQLPDLFTIQNLPTDVLDGYWIAPLDVHDGETSEQKVLDEEPFLDPEEILDPAISHDGLLETRYPGLSETTGDLVGIFGGGFQGAPVSAPDPSASGSPSTEALAFYLPYHFFGPQHWGIYITIEGLTGLANEIWSRSRRQLSPQDAWKAAKTFLFRHEQFHHKVETACTRFESVLHEPIYRTHAEQLYQLNTQNLPPGVQHEESVATQYGITEARKCFPRGQIKDHVGTALEAHADAAPAPYNEYSKSTTKSASNLYNAILSRETQKNNPDVMATFSHVDHPDLRWGGRANYICRKNSPLASRIRLGGKFLSRRKLLKVLRNEAPGELVPSKAHPSRWAAFDGKKSDVPAQKDIPLGTVKKILKDLGIQKSHRELFRGER